MTLLPGNSLALAATSVSAAVGASAAAAYACLSPGSQLCGPTLVAPPAPNHLCLTFDDGPNPAVTPALLDLLAEHGVQATFFLIGRWAVAEPALTRAIAAGGHAVGNHTWSHPWLPRHSARTIRQQMQQTSAALEDLLGKPVTLFRPPHGSRRPVVLRIARELGLDTVMWNLIVGDWSPMPAEKLTGRIVRGIERNRGAGKGTNLVLHDGGQHTPQAPRLATLQAVKALLASHRELTQFVLPPDWRGHPTLI